MISIARLARSGIVLLVAAFVSTAPRVVHASVIFLDEAERVHRTAPLPSTAIFGAGPIVLATLRDEVVAFQIVLDQEPSNEPVEIAFTRAVHTEAPGAFEIVLTSPEGKSIRAKVSIFEERFLRVARASGNEKRKESLAFDEEATPDPARALGEVVDPLVPTAIQRDFKGDRHAFFVELLPFGEASRGSYETEILVKRGDAVIEKRTVVLRVGEGALPFPRGLAFTYFDVETFQKRGLAAVRAEESARRLLHEHAIDGVTDLPRDAASDPAFQGDPSALLREIAALKGTAFSAPNTLGQNAKGGTLIFGMYGAYKDPDAEKARALVTLASRVREQAKEPFDEATAFVYSIDESCKSPRTAAWKKALDEATAGAPELRAHLRVGATCNQPAREQAAEMVFMTTDAYRPSRDASTEKQFVTVYNGRRPNAGAMVLDVPATDLLVNGWIAAKYGLRKWFYWESAFWLDGNRGGKGGKEGFDPLVVAETFHNQDGDFQNGDGILLYPGSQPAGMTDLGLTDALIPSLRLKMIRRGLLDHALIRLAREKDAARTEAIVEQMVPVALGDATGAPSWPERGHDWLLARNALHDILEGKSDSFVREEPRRAARAPALSRKNILFGSALVAVVLAALGAWLRRKNTSRGTSSR